MDQNCQIHKKEPESAICNNDQCKLKRLMCFLCKDNHMGCSREQQLTLSQAKNELEILLKQMFSSIEGLQVFCCVQQRVILEEMLINLEVAQKQITYFENIIKNSQELNWELERICLNDYKLQARIDNKTLSQYTQQYETCLSNLIKRAKIDYFKIEEQEKIMQSPLQQDSPHFQNFKFIRDLIKNKLIALNQDKFENTSIYRQFFQQGDIALIPICEILIKEKFKINQPIFDQQIGSLCYKILKAGFSPRYCSLVCFSPEFNNKDRANILETINDMQQHNLDYLSFMSAGKECLEQSSYPEANLNFKEAIKLKGDYSVLYYLNGNSLFEMKNYKEAIEQYEKAIQLEHDFTFAYIQLAKSYKITEQYKKAINACQKALIYDKSNKDAIIILQICERELKL